MLLPKAFIVEECSNVRRILEESLRHDYGTAATNPFFDELRYRLDKFEGDLKNTDDSDLANLEKASKNISELSTCISLIERSHLGEFSWAFAENFIKFAKQICLEATLQAKFVIGTKPKEAIFHISSEGGLASYKIVCESEVLLSIGKDRIFNIVFPRSLKEHVLLHAVLAHEIGHAALSIPRHKIENAKNSISDGILSKRASALKWIQQFRPDVRKVDQDQLDSWKTEFFCDLLGLLLMGPSFAGALKALLSAKDPRGTGTQIELGTHPPFIPRLSVIFQAVRILGWEKEKVGVTQKVKEAHRALWTQLKANQQVSSRKTPSSPFTDQQMLQGINGIRNAIGTVVLFDSVSQKPLENLLDNLSQFVPPVGSHVRKNGDVDLESVDFRLIIYAGWLFWALKGQQKPKSKPIEISFFNVNRLCERGILQQIAVDKMIACRTPGRT